MNSRTESFIGLSSSNDLRIALHYQDAAEILYKSNAYQDGIALPFLFLVRQFLELILKYNIRTLNHVSSCDNLINKLNMEHDLVKIHEAFLAHYKSFKAIKNIKDKNDKKYLIDLKAIVNKIVLHDHGSQGFRYCKNKEGEKIIAPQETYNLKEVFALLEKTNNFFDDVDFLVTKYKENNRYNPCISR